MACCICSRFDIAPLMRLSAAAAWSRTDPAASETRFASEAALRAVASTWATSAAASRATSACWRVPLASSPATDSVVSALGTALSRAERAASVERVAKARSLSLRPFRVRKAASDSSPATS